MTNTPFSWLIVLDILPDLCELYVEMYISKDFKWIRYNISILKFWREFPLRPKRVNKKEKKHFSCHKDILLKQYQFIVCPRFLAFDTISPQYYYSRRELPYFTLSVPQYGQSINYFRCELLYFILSVPLYAIKYKITV